MCVHLQLHHCHPMWCVGGGGMEGGGEVCVWRCVNAYVQGCVWLHLQLHHYYPMLWGGGGDGGLCVSACVE